MSYLKKLEKFIEKSTHKEEMGSDHALALRPDHVLQLRLSELSKRNTGLKIYSEILDCELWLCSNGKMSIQVKEDDPGAVIYTLDEIRRLIRLNPDPQSLRNIHNAKVIFPGSKIVGSGLREDDDKPF